MRVIHRLLVALNLLSNLAGWFFVVSGQGSCPDVAELWCQTNPTYTTLNINPGHSETIICTIPYTPGAWSTARFVNQFGDTVTDLHNVNLDSRRSDTEKNYHMNISWTSDSEIREQLKVIQCIANFQGRRQPCRTSIVIINFIDTEQEPTAAVTTRSPTTHTIQTTRPPTTQTTLQPTTQTNQTTRPPTTQTTLQPTTQTNQTTTKTSDCVCTPSQCATLIPEVSRSNNNIEPLELTSQGSNLPCVINSFKILLSLFFILLCSIC